MIPLTRLKEHWLLIAILIVAAVLRFWALDFGLPNLSRPDEQNIGHAVVETIMASFFAGQPSLNPDFFNYPSLYLYVVGFFYTVYYLLGHLAGHFADGAAFVQRYLDDWGSFLLISRAISASFGVLTVWVVYRLGRSLATCMPLAQPQRVGLLAAALMALTYLHVRDSHFGVTDVMATCLAAFSLWGSVAGYRQASVRLLYWSGAAAGLAASTKYPTGLAALAPLTAYWLLQRDAGRSLAQTLASTPRAKEILALTGCVFGTFLLASPYVLLDYNAFWRDFQSQAIYFRQRDFVPVETGPGWQYYARFALWHGLGPLYLIGALLGIGWALWQPGRRAHAIPLAFLGAYYLLMGNTYYIFVRYAIPLIPVLAAYAALLASAGAEWIHRRSGISARWAAIGLIVLMGAQPLHHSIRFNHLLAQTDTRTQARDFLLRNLQPGDGVGIGIALSHVDIPYRFNQYFLAPLLRREQDPSLIEQDGVLLTPQPNRRNEYRISTYRNASLLRELGIRYVVVGHTALTQYSTPTAEMEALAQNPELEPVARFSPAIPGETLPPAEAYDPLDAFYIPYTRFDGIERPGPELFIYRVRPASG